MVACSDCPALKARSMTLRESRLKTARSEKINAFSNDIIRCSHSSFHKTSFPA